MILRWQVMQAALPGVQQWVAFYGVTSYVITQDTGCPPGDRFYGRFAVSSKTAGRPVNHIGVFETLEEAKNAAALRGVR